VLVVIGVSLGGPQALRALLPLLRPGTDAAFVVVQHMTAGFSRRLVEDLQNACLLKVRQAEDRIRLREGEIVLVPGGSDLTVVSGGEIRLVPSRAEGPSPCIDATMSSAAQAYGAQTVGILLTGMEGDGVKGIRQIKKAGGYTLAQDAASAKVSGMVQAALAEGLIERVVPLEQMAPVIERTVLRLARAP
jgi:two-component system chemotaxis response regulator CheB